MEVTTSDKRVEYEKHRKRSDKISSLLGQYLLKGWRMLEDCCPVCNVRDVILIIYRLLYNIVILSGFALDNFINESRWKSILRWLF